MTALRQHPETSPRAGVDLIVEAAGPPRRRGEPVRCGLPWPRGQLTDEERLGMVDSHGAPVPLQARALDFWPDRSVRWVLLDWKASAEGAGRYRVEVLRPGGLTGTGSGSGARVTEVGAGGLHVDTGRARFQLRCGPRFPLESVEGRDGPAAGPTFLRLGAEDGAGRRYAPRIDRIALEEAGPVRTTVRFQGGLVRPGADPLAELSGYLHFFTGSATVGVGLTVRNPRRARYPGNCWDLGDPGSIHLKDLSLEVVPPEAGGAATVLYSPERGAAFERTGPGFELYQDSSGGENWRSTNHVNRHGVVPHSFRGYRVRAGGPERRGLRACPVVALERGGHFLAVAMRQFWENFPKAVEAGDGGLVLRLFPRQFADTHEIQGGEQKTHDFILAFGRDDVTDQPLAWCRDPLLPRAEPSWYRGSGAVPCLPARPDGPHPGALGLADSAVSGDDTFWHKREAIDEYGWRHFGEVYGDHEAVFHRGPAPLVSHYNNQYDLVAGLAAQFLRTGNPSWWGLMDELARHVVDIDIYHTDRDKSAYNGGLFWHTRHYLDAGPSTHRSYPRSHGGGGGPSGGHLYSTGLLLHHFLTGDPLSRQAVVGLGRYVIDADDGRKTVFRWLSRGFTGHVTESAPGYHGPGRAPANSVTTLLNAHVATGSAEFLEKAEQLIRRCIHPSDDVGARNLLDAERRWFYTMFLQALGRFLDHKAGLGQRDAMYAYARASLLHYARWMAAHEYLYLERPERLEYPTETWAAQDLRKGEVFGYAARHSGGEERARFLERSDYFFRAAAAMLAALPTHTLARPTALILSNCQMQAGLEDHAADSPEADLQGARFGTPEVFIPQKARAKRRLTALALWTGGLGGLAGLARLML